ncbi:MAG TPA: uracil-DNA glycosylase [Alphaproteobacteria bacterium]
MISALQWHLDVGVDEALGDEPRRAGIPETAFAVKNESDLPAPAPLMRVAAPIAEPAALAGAATLRAEAIKRAAAAQTLDELREAITSFDGLDIKRTANNTVFCDGNPRAPVMVVGEAPGGDEDRIGRPFVGVSGQLLDRILKCIGLDRMAGDPVQAIYISNILNWRPPGNRTPSPAEVEVSLPFIERHIALVKPKLLIFAGGVSAKALLGTEEGVSRLRGKWHVYTPRTEGISPRAEPIPALATYHPSYLLRTPTQKKAVWQDMLILQDKRREIGLL